MFPSGIIYQRDKSSKRGEVNLHPSPLIFTAYKLLQGVGAGLIGFGLISLIFTFGPILEQEISYTLLPKKQENGFAKALSQVQDIEAKKVRQEAESLGLSSSFSIYIPKIEAKEEIIANVDAVDKKEYLEALEEGVAHAKGTYFPGQGKNIYLFAHSTDSPLNFARYNATFYLLGRLEEGDQIVVYFADEKHTYEVVEKKITAPGDTSLLTQTADEELLILQTCYPPGTTWQRLLVLAKPV